MSNNPKRNPLRSFRFAEIHRTKAIARKCYNQSTGTVLRKKFLKNFVKLTEKHLCWSLFLNKVAGQFLRTYFFHRTPPVATAVIKKEAVHAFF